MSTLKSFILQCLSPSCINENKKAQAVVCLIICNEEIFFIKRSEGVPTHKGDVAFIGGHMKESEDALESAYREFEEESSLSRKSLNYLGWLRPSYTSSFQKIAVCCFELMVQKEKFLEDIRSNGEWDEAFFVDKEQLLLKKNWTFAGLKHPQINREIYFCELKNSTKNLWGMTASILMGIFKDKLK